MIIPFAHVLTKDKNAETIKRDSITAPRVIRGNFTQSNEHLSTDMVVMSGQVQV
jgi:hypothetical protein